MCHLQGAYLISAKVEVLPLALLKEQSTRVKVQPQLQQWSIKSLWHWIRLYFCYSISLMCCSVHHLSTTMHHCSTVHAHLLPLQPGEVQGFIYIVIAEETFFNLEKNPNQQPLLLDLVCIHLEHLKMMKMRRS